MLKKTLMFLTALAFVPALSVAALHTPGSVIIDQNGMRLIASINLHSNPSAGTSDLVWTAQLVDSVIFVAQAGSGPFQHFMCTVSRTSPLYNNAVQARTGFSNGGYLHIVRNAAGTCTHVGAANSSEFFD